MVGSLAVLLAAAVEAVAKTTIGPTRLQELTNGVYYPLLHIVIFFLTLPALSGVMRLQNKFEKITKWYSVGGICALVGLLMVLQQYVVSEEIFWRRSW
jgi:uncharacterized membrane protein YgdD (TMEM256/DUF423 family)